MPLLWLLLVMVFVPMTALQSVSCRRLLRRAHALRLEGRVERRGVSQAARVRVGLQRGEAVEAGPVAEIFAAPAHPYTQSLVAAARRFDAALEATP